MLQCDEFSQFMDSVCHRSLADGDTRQLRTALRNVQTRKGDVARIDQNEDQIVFVTQGATKLVAHASAGREQVVAFHFTDDLISVPAHAGHAYSLIALADTRLLSVPAGYFLKLTSGAAPALLEIVLRTQTALHRSRDKAVNLGRKNAQERVASFLVAMNDRIGTSARQGSTIELPMSRRDIGDSLGLTIETVSRQFTELRSLGLIETRGRSIVWLPDIAALAARAGHKTTSG